MKRFFPHFTSTALSTTVFFLHQLASPISALAIRIRVPLSFDQKATRSLQYKHGNYGHPLEIKVRSSSLRQLENIHSGNSFNERDLKKTKRKKKKINVDQGRNSTIEDHQDASHSQTTITKSSHSPTKAASLSPTINKTPVDGQLNEEEMKNNKDENGGEARTKEGHKEGNKTFPTEMLTPTAMPSKPITNLSLKEMVNTTSLKEMRDLEIQLSPFRFILNLQSGSNYVDYAELKHLSADYLSNYFANYFELHQENDEIKFSLISLRLTSFSSHAIPRAAGDNNDGNFGTRRVTNGRSLSVQRKLQVQNDNLSGYSVTVTFDASIVFVYDVNRTPEVIPLSKENLLILQESAITSIEEDCDGASCFLSVLQSADDSVLHSVSSISTHLVMDESFEQESEQSNFPPTSNASGSGIVKNESIQADGGHSTIIIIGVSIGAFMLATAVGAYEYERRRRINEYKLENHPSLISPHNTLSPCESESQDNFPCLQIDNNYDVKSELSYERSIVSQSSQSYAYSIDAPSVNIAFQEMISPSTISTWLPCEDDDRRMDECSEGASISPVSVVTDVDAESVGSHTGTVANETDTITAVDDDTVWTFSRVGNIISQVPKQNELQPTRDNKALELDKDQEKLRILKKPTRFHFPEESADEDNESVWTIEKMRQSKLESRQLHATSPGEEASPLAMKATLMVQDDGIAEMEFSPSAELQMAEPQNLKTGLSPPKLNRMVHFDSRKMWLKEMITGDEDDTAQHRDRPQTKANTVDNAPVDLNKAIQRIHFSKRKKSVFNKLASSIRKAPKTKHTDANKQAGKSMDPTQRNGNELEQHAQGKNSLSPRLLRNPCDLFVENFPIVEESDDEINNENYVMSPLSNCNEAMDDLRRTSRPREDVDTSLSNDLQGL